MLVGVAMKRVMIRPEVDAITGDIHTDDRFFTVSPADEAALEWALRVADAWDGEVIVASAGPREATEILKDAQAAGAVRAVRVDLPASAPSDVVAAGLAEVFAEAGAGLVLTGDWSLDRGSGSVPAFLAGRLGWAQALGCVALTTGPPGTLDVERRLEHGRRERLRLTGSGVVSMAGGTAELRRAGLTSVLHAGGATVEVVVPKPVASRERAARVVHTRPFRPRTNVVAGPRGDVRDRLLELTGASTDRTPPRAVTAEPDEAADLLLEQLREWGYLEPRQES